ncbi:helix-turn-helix DNA binding domain protein [Bacillus phage Chotacabras]|nr:helix-turn-helix DNA binding domain protein [Bacillus phage Chotacabras]
MAVGAKTVTASTHLECEVCGNVTMLWRKRSKMKQKQHLKHMYCPKCKETTGHYELRDDVGVPAWIKEFQDTHAMRRGD